MGLKPAEFERRKMAKKHKIVVTRNKNSGIYLWSIETKLHKDNSGIWRSRSWSIGKIYLEKVKEVLGFIPRKGTKETITITRQKK